jgi:hypothetical protein
MGMTPIKKNPPVLNTAGRTAAMSSDRKIAIDTKLARRG